MPKVWAGAGVGIGTVEGWWGFLQLKTKMKCKCLTAFNWKWTYLARSFIGQLQNVHFVFLFDRCWSHITKCPSYGTTQTGYGTTPVACGGGSRYFEGVRGFLEIPKIQNIDLPKIPRFHADPRILGNPNNSKNGRPKLPRFHADAKSWKFDKTFEKHVPTSWKTIEHSKWKIKMETIINKINKIDK